MMQYMMQMSDEFKDIARENKDISLETQDLMRLVLVRMQELETRVNSNRNDEQE